eukprot:c25295_g2_i2 orf=2-883(-)
MSEMLGKRHRPLPRTTSKLQITPDDNLLHFPAFEYFSGAPKPSTAYFEPRRQVIGFNPIRKETDTCSGPRPALPGIASTCMQEKPLSSPRSGLESLSSGSRAREKKRNECAGGHILTDKSTVEGNAASSDQTYKSLMLHDGLAVQSAGSANQQRSSQEIQPILISLDNFNNPHPGKKDQDRVNRCRDKNIQESFPRMSADSRGRSSHQGHMPPVHYTAVDVEMSLQGSIFSTSPTSSTCNDISGLLPATDFLSYCHFCNRQLRPGRDIYMYRGDKAFCSVECRYQQIAIDESKE